MEEEEFNKRLFAFYKTTEGQEWKRKLSEKLKKCKTTFRQDRCLRFALEELKENWLRTEYYQSLGFFLN